MFLLHPGFRNYSWFAFLFILLFRSISCFSVPVHSISHGDSLVSLKIKQARFDESITLIAKYIQQAQSPDEVMIYKLRLCEVYWSTGNAVLLQKNISELILPSQASAFVRFRYYLMKGRAQFFAGNTVNGLTLLKKAENYISDVNQNNDISAIELYMELGRSYKLNSEFRTSEYYYHKALERMKHSNRFRNERIYCYVALSVVNSNPLKSDSLIQICLHFIQKQGNKPDPVMLPIYMELVEYYLNLDIIDRVSESYLHLATAILNQYYPKSHFYYGLLYYYKCTIKYNVYDSENAFHYGILSQKIIENYPSYSYYIGQNSLLLSFIYYWFHKDFPKTIECCREITDNPKISDRIKFYAHNLIGLSELRMGNTAHGKQILISILQNSNSYKISDPNIFTNIYAVLGNIAHREKNSNLTFYYLNKSCNLARVCGLKEELSNIHANLGKAYYYLKNDDQNALREFHASIIAGCKKFSDTRLESNPSVSDILEPYILVEIFTYKAYLFYRLYLKNPKNLAPLKTALECQELSVKIYERMLWGIQDENSGLKMADKNATDLNNAVSYAVLLYLKTKDPFYAEKALKYSEKSKMQLMLIRSKKKENLFKFGIPDSIIDHEHRLHNQILELENMLTLSEKSGAVMDHRNNDLAILYDQRDALINQIEIHYPEYYKAKYSYYVAGLSEIRNHLKDNEVILEYQLLNTELITFLISKKGLKLYYQKIDPELQTCIEKLYHVVSTYPTADTYMDSYNDFVYTSAYLYQKLIAPVYPYLKGNHLIIIPHNNLNRVPFEVLLSSPPRNNPGDFRSLHYLIKEFPIVYAYSANLLLENNTTETRGIGTAVFLPDYTRSGTDKQFFTLKGAEDEAKVICNLSNGHIYEGIDASEESFKINSNGYGVLHIASHALMDDTIPMLSSIVMSYTGDTTEDGYLYAYEISQLNLNAQMVVLNGCNTGYGVLRKSEGLISIARSFFYTGVKTVAYSLWPVADNSGSVLVSGFYKELKKKKRLDDALRDTKLSFIESTDPVKAHPYYWANFMIAGNTDPVRFYKYPVWLKAIVLVIIAGAFFGVYYKFRATS